MADVLSAQKDAQNNTLSLWQGVYNTQLVGAIGPRIVIKDSVVTVNGTTINGATVNNGILSWSDASNDSNAQLNFHPMAGVAPSLVTQSRSSKLSTSEAEPSAEPSAENSAMIPNAYVAPQFTGLYWMKGWPKPSQINFQGRQGKFPRPGSLPPSSNANSAPMTGQANKGSNSTPAPANASTLPDVGPRQASTLDQWASSYDVWVSTSSGLAQSNNDTFVIDTSGNLTVNGIPILKPLFTNDLLSWSTSDGNSSNGDFTMQDHTSAGKTSLVDGDQFTGRYWAQGQTEPTTNNWFGFARPQDSSSTKSDGRLPTPKVASPQISNPNVTKATQNMNFWVTLTSIGLEALHNYMMFKLGEMLMKGVNKVLLYAWRAIRWVCGRIRQWYRNMRNNRPAENANDADDGERDADDEGDDEGDDEPNPDDEGGNEQNANNEGSNGQNTGEQGGDAAAEGNAGSGAANGQPKSTEAEMAEIEKKEKALEEEAREAELQKKAQEEEVKKMEGEKDLDSSVKEGENMVEGAEGAGDDAVAGGTTTTTEAAATTAAEDVATTAETGGGEVATIIEDIISTLL
ncbi:hypothetical protein FCIRC_618 [Fusarium circinatum]|uniref:Uncharacterized protein n=1 Tax=Fusarium circinatum TaxID=48490 RepID=A0A8H5X822_FUSCI|nr:hypothetical protein FCIRC_618 [Fusarium circinatum]